MQGMRDRDQLQKEAAYIEKEIKRTRKDRFLHVVVELICAILFVIAIWYFRK